MQEGGYLVSPLPAGWGGSQHEGSRTVYARRILSSIGNRAEGELLYFVGVAPACVVTVVGARYLARTVPSLDHSFHHTCC